MSIIEKIATFQKANAGKPFFSFEYFPPKTDAGERNLYERFDRMAALNPMWIDVTWGAGGSTASKTLDICTNAVTYHGLDVMMHLTCTNMSVESLKEALDKCKASGIRNILALRGDPPADAVDGEWKAVEGGFNYAVDLVKYIRKEYGSWFCVGVAAYPEGHIERTSMEDDIKYLKEKCDAGADLVVTQLFYDVDLYCEFVDKCKALGITIPIVPGIMPIQSYAGFKKMTEFCKTNVPQEIADALEEVKDNEAEVKNYGVKLGMEMCEKLMARGAAPGLHFYTLNLETAVCRIIDGLKLVDPSKSARTMPWMQSKHSDREQEQVRPIFWANRQKSYIARTSTWDEYPNGRFGNRSSPAYGDFNFVSYNRESLDKLRPERLKMWGEPKEFGDVEKIFEGYVSGTVKNLPWCQEMPADETSLIKRQLVRLNQVGLLTINSQPRVNGALSTDPYVGWGPSDGFVYQKAYLEFFCSKDTLETLMAKIEAAGDAVRFSFTAVTQAGEVESNVDEGNVNAVTWGIFPAAEVVQPTVVDTVSFMAWKDEAFQLWGEWEHLYEEGTESRKVVADIKDSYYLVNIVDNDFVGGDLFHKLARFLEKAPCM